MSSCMAYIKCSLTPCVTAGSLILPRNVSSKWSLSSTSWSAGNTVVNYEGAEAMMGREESRAWAVKLLNEWSEHFNVKPPSFRYNRTGSHGIYYSGRREVTVAVPESYRYGRTMEHSLVHEFAHHLADERLREIRRLEEARGVEWFKRTDEHAHHGPNFKNALLDVATHHYVDPNKY